MKVTRQGLRDLDALGARPKRGHVGRVKVIDKGRCFHSWQHVECDTDCWIIGTCSHAHFICPVCKATR